MGGGIFGQDFSDKEVTQETYNAQATTQYGNAYGAAAGRKNVGATGLGVYGGFRVQPKTKAGKNSSVVTGDTNVSIVSNDPAVAIKALESNQALSTLSIGLSQQNANEALRTLQLLNSQHNVADAGGTGSQVLAAGSDNSAGSIAGNFLSGITTTQKVVIGVLVAGTIGFVIYRLTK